jgi:hypothetical protein
MRVLASESTLTNFLTVKRRLLIKKQHLLNTKEKIFLSAVLVAAFDCYQRYAIALKVKSFIA